MKPNNIQIGDKYQHGKDIVEVIDVNVDMVTFGWQNSNYWQTHNINSPDMPKPIKPNYKAIVDKAIGEKPNLVKENIILIV